MNGDDYSTPLPVSRACFDEIRRRMLADGRLVGDRETVVEMRGVALVAEDVPQVIDALDSPVVTLNRDLLRLEPVPDLVRLSPAGSTFTVEHGDWRYSGVPATIVRGAAHLDLSKAWQQERLSSPSTRTR